MKNPAQLTNPIPRVELSKPSAPLRRRLDLCSAMKRARWAVIPSALACFAVSPAAQGGKPAQIKVDKATRARVSESYGKLPLSFEANGGQQDPQVKFLSRGSGYNLFLTNREAVLVLTKSEKLAPASANKMTHATLSQEPKRQSIVLRTQIVGADPAAKVTGKEELPGRVNHFIGSDPAKWHTDVVTYAKVRYEQVYPGIDLVYYGNQGQLEYDFVVGPGADPSRLRLRMDGAQKMYVDSQGRLVVQTGGGALCWNKPNVYQQAGGKRQAVKGKYVLRRGHELGFEVAAYDTAKSLIIDPSLVYSTYLGGTSFDSASGIAVDTSGNAYVTGWTTSTNFPTTPGAFQTMLNGSTFDIFVTVLNPTGTALIYSTYLGGTSADSATGIAVDTAGNAYVTGGTYSTDFPTTPGAYQTTFGGYYDAYATELNPTGSALVYSTYLGGSDIDGGHGIAVDTSGNAYVAGDTDSANFPTTAGAFQITSSGSKDAFVTELNPTGSALVYSTYLGGSGLDYGDGVALDTSGNAYITGEAYSSDFPTTAGAFQTTYNGLGDGFVTELNSAGTGLLYSTYLGGSGSEHAVGVAVDTAGNAYITGYTTSTDFPTTAGAFQTTFDGLYDRFVTKLNPAGTGLLYSTYLGGSSGDYGGRIAVDTAGNAYVTGYTTSTDFPTTPGAFQTTFGEGSTDAFVSELNSTGTELLYSTFLGSRNRSYGTGVAVDTRGNAYVTGYTLSTNFPTTPGAFQTEASGGASPEEAFVTKIDTGHIVLTASAHRMGETVLVRLAWTGANSPKMDIYRDEVQIARVRNTGRYRDSLSDSGTYIYKVCAGGGVINCSNEVTVRVP